MHKTKGQGPSITGDTKKSTNHNENRSTSSGDKSSRQQPDRNKPYSKPKRKFYPDKSRNDNESTSTAATKPVQPAVPKNQPERKAPKPQFPTRQHGSRGKSNPRKAIPSNNATEFPNTSPLRVIPLGGMREIGKNMFVYEYENDIIIVDCGLGFPEENMPGIDIVIPDMSYVFSNRHKVRGIFFTHGHEDHIGAIAWLSNEVRAPIYGSKLTIALIEAKLEDRGGSLKTVNLNPVEDGAVISSGCFDVEFIHSTHSIADANILSIESPAGIVVHTGDFKIDFTPITGEPMNLSRLAEISSRKPLLLMCESTNVEKPGFSMSESKVGESFINIFEKAPGRVIIATFSSNIYRMQQIITAAEHFGRKVCLIGRSVISVFRAADKLGYMKYAAGTIVDVSQIKFLPAERVVIISTGSQGEPLSALTRMAFNEHQMLEITKGDTVILSSTPIPGNEKPIYRVINELYLRGANVIYASLAEVHASGHAYQEELKLLNQMVKSRYFVPIHGEYRMLHQHSILAQKLGYNEKNIFLLSNGDILELTHNSARLAGSVPAEGVLVDGSGFAQPGNTVLKERETLAGDGVITVSLAVDTQSKEIVGDIIIFTRGFLYDAESTKIISDCKTKVINFARKAETSNKPLIAMLKSNSLREQLKDFLYERTRRRPILIISVIEI